eukprot:CAMPEP_0174877856 /NCGR_PEP_ID=MMETSP1114-20130205/82464_1 /TAXON_ID=312471 /ORGANISM="Neobodo designis, Strain CCAP 1951/1" /LENGTH=985 /DNA_ID=CAMNT_0016113243 /DNA_START=232 /DNA_END=3189 /DNA_ORIENTATION=-
MKSNAVVREARETVSDGPSPKQPAAAPRKKQPSRLPSIEGRPEWNPSVGNVPSFFGDRNYYRASEPYKPPQECVHRDLADDMPPFITAIRPSDRYRPIGHEFLPDPVKGNKVLPPIRSKSSDPPAADKPKRSKSAPRREHKVPAPPANPQPKTARPSNSKAAPAPEKPRKEKKEKKEKKSEPSPDRKSKAEKAKEEEETQKNLFVDGKLIMDDNKALKKLFKRLDGNASGQLSLAELDLGVKSLYPGFDNKPAIMRAYKAADSTGEGFIGFDEFKFFMQFLVYYNNLWDAFAAADDDDDRRMELDEFKDIAPALDIEDPEATFNEIDENGGGYVLFDEFCLWIAKHRPGLEIEMSRAIVEVEEEEDKAAASHQPKVNKTKVQKNDDPVPDAAMTIQVPPKAKCMELFNQLDPNGNGMLSLAELDKGVVELWPDFNNKPAIMRAYKAADRSGEGFVTRSEFGFFLRFLQYYNNLWNDFCAADDDGDRRITKDEFMNDAEKLQIEDPAAVFDEMDENGGGVVLFDEFCAWMAKNKSDWGTEKIDHGDADAEPSHQPKVNKTKVQKNDDPVPDAAMTIQVPPKAKCMELFNQLDPNGNGMLSLAELDKGVVELWPDFNNKPAIMRAYKAADRSGEGFVTRSEFGFFLRFLQYYNNLWNDFCAADDDGDRRITKDEFMNDAEKLQIEDPAAVFDEMDENGGGVVLFDEFCAWMAKNKSDWGTEKIDHGDADAEPSHQPKVNKTKVQKNDDPVPDAAMTIQVPPKAKCMELFNQLDPNGNGMLSLAELDKGVVELWPDFNNKPAIMRAYKAADRSGEGFVTRSEFGFFLRFLQYYNNLWNDFCAADDDGDRRITKDEFMNDAEKLQIEDPAAVFDEMDENGGGVVLFDEFCAWMAKNKSDWGGEDAAKPADNDNDSVRSPTPAEDDDAKRDEAATKIQSLQRGRAARKRAAEVKAAKADEKAADEAAAEDQEKAASGKADAVEEDEHPGF